jgi:hypothetical protein
VPQHQRLRTRRGSRRLNSYPNGDGRKIEKTLVYIVGLRGLMMVMQRHNRPSLSALYSQQSEKPLVGVVDGEILTTKPVLLDSYHLKFCQFA